MSPDGTVWVAEPLSGNVVDAQDPTDVLIGDWATGNVWAVGPGGPLPLATGLSFPEGLAVDGDRLLVVETGAQRVVGIDLATGALSEVLVGFDFTLQNPIGSFPWGNLSSVAVGHDGSLYVSDDGANSVYRSRGAARSTR